MAATAIMDTSDGGNSERMAGGTSGLVEVSAPGQWEGGTWNDDQDVLQHNRSQPQSAE